MALQVRLPFLRRRPFENRRVAQRLDDATERLIREADVAALRRAGFVRAVVAGLLLLSVLLAETSLGQIGQLALRQIHVAEATLVLFGSAGLVSAWLANRRIAISWLPTLAATVDACLILGNLTYSLWSTGVSGAHFTTFPIAWAVPIALAATAIHYHPRLQAYVAGLYVVGIALLVFSGTYLTPSERIADLGELSEQFSAQANGVRLMMIFAFGLVLFLVARQGRFLLERAVRETTLRLNLTRYLPSELAPILTEREFEGLREGRRITVTMLFVDIRASSQIGEGMDPARLAVFMSAFRRRVTRAVTQSGGVIDKFIGDGALVLFGVPSGSPSDAARALSCAHLLLRLVARWNEKRGFDPPVRIGIGVHTGEVFCGVVGDEDRLEFTVLGEAVNIAARIEQATKTTGYPLLASKETLDASGETEGWFEIEAPSLAGVTRPVRLFAFA
ncbi:adenylate/guanylate cyclase domain-containing protein [Microvirga flavescens]|uniref:adenylate/guanylate cyclase domain-containing protein n=1 Tax=Microvirga flavescens TaxID=2249811 RepID=UPI0013002914|nr:adenylate/guanylate cyclase domain-containing protein [Microvirga flavescens]